MRQKGSDKWQQETVAEKWAIGKIGRLETAQALFRWLALTLIARCFKYRYMGLKIKKMEELSGYFTLGRRDHDPEAVYPSRNCTSNDQP